MQNPCNFGSEYPVSRVFQSPVQSVVGSTQASVPLAASVVLAAASAAVQGVADVRAPYGVRKPTNLFVGGVSLSGSGKSSALEQVTAAFEEFEQGTLGAHWSAPLPSGFPAHPFLIDRATEQGVIDLFRAGAKSLFYAIDEGAVLFKGLDIPSLCKRFDGATIRHVTRNGGAMVLADTRASMCMLTQDVTFDRLMRSKGEVLIESGLLPRMLMCFDRADSSNRWRFTSAAASSQDLKPFHERIRALLIDYGTSLANPSFQRAQLELESSASCCWYAFAAEMDNLLASGWNDIRPFVKRAGELVLRVAAVLQWFADPGPKVGRWAIDDAIDIVKWHLAQAKLAFGALPLEVEERQLSEMLYDYLMRKARTTGQTAVNRGLLLRNGPKPLRNADSLDLALHGLARRRLVGILQPRQNQQVVVLEMFPPRNAFEDLPLPPPANQIVAW